MKHVKSDEIAEDISVAGSGPTIIRGRRFGRSTLEEFAAVTALAKPRPHWGAKDEPTSELKGLIWAIDDDIAVLALLRSVFGREGYEVQQSSTVAEALSQMHRAADVSLVILDFNIPGGSGLDVLRKLRQTSDAPVVMISNIKRPELLAQAFDLGADDFVEKPFNPRSLLVRAQRLIE